MLRTDSLSSTFSALFEWLDQTGYAWEPLSPERLLAARKEAREESWSPLVRRFGLGLRENYLPRAPSSLLRALRRLDPAVARVAHHWVPHEHWGRRDSSVYLGAESATLARLLQARGEIFSGRSVLDLGSGSGVLSFAVSPWAKRVLGIEAEAKAVAWATAAARAQGIQHASFAHATIGDAAADLLASPPGSWDFVVFNPPMAIPSPAGPPRPSRDGGDLGVGLPLRFLEFAGRALRSGGHALFLATDPIPARKGDPGHSSGNGIFTARLDPSKWELILRQRLHADFNRSLFRQDMYANLGISRIELVFFELRRRAGA